MNEEYYYRYGIMRWTEDKIELVDYKHLVIKKTPKGVWIEEYLGKKRFILNSARKKFACKTLEEALESFRAKKRRQIKILKYQLKEAERALSLEPGQKVYILFHN